ncbi:probably inactive leucine-rich repeat receptor-like protein kinase At5g48380 [Nymphaea colorata]|nr:probably inactive leucine-rich repeat receptor-like protein kinase At5g48380 [Nymphaea colorata]
MGYVELIMTAGMNYGRMSSLFIVVILLTSIHNCHCIQSDIECLKSLQQSLDDPNNSLASWKFQNNSEGYICNFVGVECWHPNENRVLNIRLSSMGLQGQFPTGLANCTSMTGLDLSDNQLAGPLPTNISHYVGFVTSLDLSKNKFTGEIPDNLKNCTYLNSLKLDSNLFTGGIPPGIGQLSRLKTFSVASNKLTGNIPPFVNPQPPESFASNEGLCGPPLPNCQSQAKNNHAVVTAATVSGGILFIALLIIIVLMLFCRKKPKKKDEDIEGNKWAKDMIAQKGVKVSVFENSIPKLKLRDLMKFTNNFSKHNIINSGRTGTVYKATLSDGSFLAVKRLQDSQHTEKQFKSEMETLGKVRHHNLVPLLGFCVAKRERLLVYKHMPRGTLYQQLHVLKAESEVMAWPTRMRISIGAARGLAWLHHSCNPRIIHRNISSHCILLDDDYEPKISDFGLARLMNPVDTHLSTYVNGEFGVLGYVAPEYARTLVATPKGDVYSFGVVLLEIVTGEESTHVANAPESFKGNLVDWITQLSSNSVVQDAIDRSLAGRGFDDELLQFLRVACACVLSAPKERPSMFEVYQLLRAIGQKYLSTTYDEMPLEPSNVLDDCPPDELIVATDAR